MVAERPYEDTLAPAVRRKLEDLRRAGAHIHGRLPPEVIERIHAYEFGPKTTDLEQLAKRGVAMPPAAALDDAQLSAHLAHAIGALAELRVYLQYTDHLDDRALYDRLERDVLREPHGDHDDDPDAFTVIDLIGFGPDREAIWLAYYADEDERDRADPREGHVPERSRPPADRDRHLPTPFPEGDRRRRS